MSLIPFILLPVVAILELLGWFTTNSLYLKLARLELKQDIALPQVLELSALTGLEGGSENLTWRWQDGALVFKRKMRLMLGRKAYYFGRVVFDADGNSRVFWAPFPLLVYPVMVLAMPIVLVGQEPDSGVFGALVAMPVVLVVGALNALFSYMSLKNQIHELETALMDDLAARGAI